MFYSTLSILLQENLPPELLRQGFNISPDSVYGFLVVLLLLIGVAGGMAYVRSEKQARKEREVYFSKIEKLAQDSIRAVEHSSGAIDDMRDTLDKHNDILQSLRSLIELIAREKR